MYSWIRIENSINPKLKEIQDYNPGSTDFKAIIQDYVRTGQRRPGPSCWPWVQAGLGQSRTWLLCWCCRSRASLKLRPEPAPTHRREGPQRAGHRLCHGGRVLVPEGPTDRTGPCRQVRRGLGDRSLGLSWSVCIWTGEAFRGRRTSNTFRKPPFLRQRVQIKCAEVPLSKASPQEHLISADQFSCHQTLMLPAEHERSTERSKPLTEKRKRS